MALKLFQQEALDIVRKIWEEDLVEGRFFYKEGFLGRERVSDGYYIEKEPKGSEKKWRKLVFSDVKSVLLLAELDLISFKEDIFFCIESPYGELLLKLRRKQKQ